MNSLTFTTSKSERDLQGILLLQEKNLSSNLSEEEIKSQGFVTVVHRLADLKKMNDIEQHVICKDGDEVIAYLLAMNVQTKNDIPVLFPMFEAFEKVLYHGKPVSTYQYIVVGQVCVDKNYRGHGVLDKCYSLYKEVFKDRYDFALTEIAVRNVRSIRAHLRIGFHEICTYTSPDTEEWSIVIWNW